jgi:hypothetical protein
MLLMFASLAIVWAMRAFQVDRPVRVMALAGAFAGLAAGAKLTAVPMLILGIPLALAVARPRLIAAGAAFVLAGMLVLSPWLIRNAVWTGGNPVFPLALHALGHGHFTAVQVQRFELAHTPPPDQSPPAARLGRFFDEILIHWQCGFALWPLVIVAAVQQRRNARVRACLVMLLVMSIVWIGFTHLIGRFFILAVPAAAVMIGEIRWERLAPLGIALVVITAGLGLFGPNHLNDQFVTWAARGRDGAFGLADSSVLVPPVLAEVEHKTDQMVVMIGRAGVFADPIPMSRLRYRTVFDIASDEIQGTSDHDVFAAWAGIDIDQLPPDAQLYIDPSELFRLSATYYHLPPPLITGVAPQPFLIPARSLRH